MYISHQHWASPELTEVAEKICWQRSQALAWYHASMHAVCETMLGCSAKNLQEKWKEKARDISHDDRLDAPWCKSKASFLHMFLHTNRGKKIGEVVFLQQNDAWWLILPSSCPTLQNSQVSSVPHLQGKHQRMLPPRTTSSWGHLSIPSMKLSKPVNIVNRSLVLCKLGRWSFPKRHPNDLSLIYFSLYPSVRFSAWSWNSLWVIRYPLLWWVLLYYYQGQKTNEVKLTTWMLWTASRLSQAAMAWRNATPSLQSHSLCPPWRFQPLPFGPQNQSKTLEQIEQRKCSSSPHLFSGLATIGWGFHFFQPEAGTVKDSVLAWVSSSTKTMLIYDVCTPANWLEGKAWCLETLPVRLRSRHRTKADHFCQAATRAASSKSAATDLTNSNSQIKICHLTLVKFELERKRIYAPCLYCTCFP